MTEPKLTYDKEITSLPVIDPYQDFMSEGGKVWDRLRTVAFNSVEAVEPMLTMTVDNIRAFLAGKPISVVTVPAN
jgi:hypothetical protein